MGDAITEPFIRGTRVVKTNSDPKQRHQDGARGRIDKAIGPASEDSDAPGTYGYFVVFDSDPEFPVFVAGSRLVAESLAASG